MSEFRDLARRDNEVVSVYQHIDNGGFSVSVNNNGTLVISHSFFGYAQTTVEMPNIDLPGLIKALTTANEALERNRIIEKLSCQ